jgi:hypothetical protein
MRVPKLVWGGGLALLVLGGALASAGLFNPSSWPNEPMPPFEEELYLRIVAQWSREGCVDVVTYTNLPDGTEVRVSGEARASQPYPGVSMTNLTHVDDQELVLIHGRRNEMSAVLCRLARPLRQKTAGANGVLVRVDVHWISQGRAQEQEQRIGKRGLLLKGPHSVVAQQEGQFRAHGESNTVILEPLP